jgi:type IV pilus assembly protein PilQ
MIIDANISDIVDMVYSPDGKSASPATTDQEINTIRRVYDGETVVIGGLIRQNQDHDVTKIPLLGDLPLIGPLFQSTSITADDTELLIFITPRIIHDSINMNKIIN